MPSSHLMVPMYILFPISWMRPHVHYPPRNLVRKDGTQPCPQHHIPRNLNDLNPHPGPLRNPIHLSLPPEITFTGPDNENLPVQSSPCMLLVQKSPSLWVAEYFDKQDRVVEDLGTWVSKQKMEAQRKH